MNTETLISRIHEQLEFQICGEASAEVSNVAALSLMSMWATDERDDDEAEDMDGIGVHTPRRLSSALRRRAICSSNGGGGSSVAGSDRRTTGGSDMGSGSDDQICPLPAGGAADASPPPPAAGAIQPPSTRRTAEDHDRNVSRVAVTAAAGAPACAGRVDASAANGAELPHGGIWLALHDSGSSRRRKPAMMGAGSAGGKQPCDIPAGWLV